MLAEEYYEQTKVDSVGFAYVEQTKLPMYTKDFARQKSQSIKVIVMSV